MPSTYTTNLGIEKIATGEQSGTWGDTTNTNFDLIDQAINGIVQVTLPAAGSSGSPKALTITDGTSSDGRNKFIEFVDGGDLGATAYVQLTPNDAEKIVHIRNSLSGSRSIIVFQGTYNASNDFEIPNGADVLLKFDGAGTGAVVSDVNLNLTATAATIGTVTGDLTGNVTGNVTGDLTGNVTGNVTGDVTGDLTGAVLTANQPNITGLGTIGSLVATTADINGGTIDGTTIGGSSASAGSFTTLSTSGTATLSGLHVDSTDAVEMPTGTEAQRPTPVSGMLRFNTDATQFEGYDGTAWGSIGGGASGGGGDAIFYENDQTVTNDYTIASDKNAMTTGPISINSGVTITIETGARLVVL